MEIAGYEITRKIGEGGMAVAYLAVQRSLGRHVVLKVLKPFANVRTDIAERFFNEARLIAAIEHPCVIAIHDVGSSGEDRYIATEFLPGGDLKQRMRRGPFTADAALEVIEKLAGGLAAVHERGIVHRDVKPGNILFRADGTPVLSDFGIAKRLDHDPDLTATGKFIGSPNYMSPEQSEIGAVDGRADIYALGVIFYEMLSGQRAYVGASIFEVISQHKRAPVPRFGPEHTHCQDLLERMMAKRVSDRFADARDLLEYIGDMRLSGAAPRSETAVPSAVGRGRRRSSVFLLVALAVCAGGWALLYAWEQRMRSAALPTAQFASAFEPLSPPPVPGRVRRAEVFGGADPTPVVAALAWLGQQSLDARKLTAPAEDNAYHYFSRLLQIEPGNPVAQRGLREIAAHYARFAAQAWSDGRYAEARRHIAAGLHINPEDAALRALREKTRAPRAGEGVSSEPGSVRGD